MTETSGYTESWADSIRLGQDIYLALKYGHASAWVWWQISENDGTGNPPSEYSLMNLGVPGKKYYVSKQYYRYVRPGAVRVESSTNNSDVLVTAFHHKTNRTVAIVLINTGASEKLVTLNITGGDIPQEFNVYRTSATENCINAGTVPSDGQVVLAASSITTLYGRPLVNFYEFTKFAGQWLQTECTGDNQWCGGADFNHSGKVDLLDMRLLADEWLLESPFNWP